MTNLRHLSITFAVALAGWASAFLFGLNGLTDSSTYRVIITVMLAVGLYSSVYGIQLQFLRTSWRLVITAITFGVVLKIIIIGGIVFSLSASPISFLLAAIVAQIDPLSVAALSNTNRLSVRARAILGAWSSFDDPITVILAFYIATSLGGGEVAVSLSPNGMPGILLDIGLNLLFAIGACFYQKAIGSRSWFLCILGLCVCFVVSVVMNWMLGIALVGLFIRPDFSDFLDTLTTYALYGATFMLGLLLVNGVDVEAALFVGIAAILAQIVVALVLARSLERVERYQLALAQQNGITAIVLALLYESQFTGTVAIVAPAIFIINLVYIFSNYVLERKMGTVATT